MDYVLATSTLFATNNAKLIQGKYVLNSSYKDEWKLYKIGDNDVMFLAISEADGRDRISEFSNVFDYLTDNGNHFFNFINTDNISSTSCLNQMSSSSIFVSRSHGNYSSNESHIELSEDGSSILYSNQIYNNGTTLVDMSSLMIAIFAACYTGTNSSTGKNLADATVNAGASYAVGFNDSISCGDANNWVERFFYYYCCAGYGVAMSCSAATADVSGMAGKCHLAY